MKNKFFKRLIVFIGKERIIHLLNFVNNTLRKIASKFHSFQMSVKYEMGPLPEWFDHHLDMYYLWERDRNPLWLERGLYSMLALKKDGNVLELCCGDGFNAKYFYSIKAKTITSVDFDKKAIAHATRYNSVDNVNFTIADIRHEMPEGTFDNIVIDAAIEHFTESEIDTLMSTIKQRLAPTGVLSGYTIAVKENKKSFVLHEYEFKSKEDLVRFFIPHFKNVKVFETIYPTRHNLYFWASDGILPFDNDWDAQVMEKQQNSAKQVT